MVNDPNPYEPLNDPQLSKASSSGKGYSVFATWAPFYVILTVLSGLTAPATRVIQAIGHPPDSRPSRAATMALCSAVFWGIVGLGMMDDARSIRSMLGGILVVIGVYWVVANATEIRANGD